MAGPTDHCRLRGDSRASERPRGARERTYVEGTPRGLGASADGDGDIEWGWSHPGQGCEQVQRHRGLPACDEWGRGKSGGCPGEQDVDIPARRKFVGSFATGG